MDFFHSFLLLYVANPRVYDCRGEAELRSLFHMLPYASNRDGQMLLVLRSFVARTRTETARALKLYLFLTAMHARRLYPSLGDMVVECAMEDLKWQSAGSLTGTSPALAALPFPEDLHKFTPFQLHNIAALAVADGREVPECVHFTERYTFGAREGPVDGDCVISSAANIRVSPPLTEANSLQINRLTCQKTQRWRIAVFCNLNVGDSWLGLITALAKAKVRMIFAQQQVSDSLKEYLDDAGIFFFERLGKARTEKLVAELHTTLFEPFVEFILRAVHSTVSLPTPKIAVAWINDQLTLELDTGNGKPSVSVATNERNLVGTTVPLRRCQNSVPTRSILAELCNPAKPTELGRQLAIGSLLFFGAALGPLLKSNVSEAAVAELLHSLLAEAVDDVFFQELEYILRTRC